MENSSKDQNKLNFICINCGAAINELYTKYSSSVLKLNHCVKCNKIADKYIEFEPIIIIIDLVLVSRQAFRHVLFNTYFSIHWKIAVVLSLFESYNLWLEKSTNLMNVDSFTSEKRFYMCFALTVLDNILLFVILRLFTKISSVDRQNNNNNNRNLTEKQFLLLLLKTVTLANVTKFFLLPIVIWKNHLATNYETYLHTLLITLYFIISLIHIYSVLVNCSRLNATIYILLILTIKSILSMKLSNRFEEYFSII